MVIPLYASDGERKACQLLRKAHDEQHNKPYARLIVSLNMDMDGPEEPNRVLDVLKGHIQDGFDEGVLHDRDGNIVCQYKVIPYGRKEYVGYD